MQQLVRPRNLVLIFLTWVDKFFVVGEDFCFRDFGFWQRVGYLLRRSGGSLHQKFQGGHICSMLGVLMFSTTEKS
jgi:hypothetical protein